MIHLMFKCIESIEYCVKELCLISQLIFKEDADSRIGLHVDNVENFLIPFNNNCYMNFFEKAQLKWEKEPSHIKRIKLHFILNETIAFC